MQRIVYTFAFEDGEKQHRDQLAATEHDLLQLISAILTHTYGGFDYVVGLPSFDKRDKRTLLAGLVARTFTSVNCAMNLAVRGYHVQAIMLVRSTLEDDWLFYELSNSVDAVEWMYSNQWPKNRRWSDIVAEIDAAVSAGSGGAINPGDYKQQIYSQTYGQLSEITHPRPQGLRLQFDEHGTRLETGPLMYDSSFRTALLHGLSAALANHRQVRALIEGGQESAPWIAEHQRLQAQAESWLQQQPTAQPVPERANAVPDNE